MGNACIRQITLIGNNALIQWNTMNTAPDEASLCCGFSDQKVETFLPSRA